MSDVKPPLFRRNRAALETTVPLEAASGNAGLLDNLRFVWKQLLIILAMALGIGLVVFTALGGFRSLENTLQESYDLVLTPTKVLQDGLLNFADSQRYFLLLADKTLSTSERQETLTATQQALKIGEEKYKLYVQKYATANRPAFAQALRDSGRADFLADEKSALNSLDAILAETKALEQAYLEEAALRAPPSALASAVVALRGQARSRLQALMDVNDSFSSVQRDFANANATRAVQLMIIALLVSLAVGGILATLVTRSLTTRLSALEQSAQALRSGNLDMRVAVSGRDEIGTVAASLNTSIEQLRDFVRQQEEDRQKGLRLQQNVSNFLDVAMQISQGDLTQRGKVSEDALGNVVDAINVMTEEMGFLLKDVQQTATRVSSSAATMNSASQEILSDAQSQSNIAATAQEQTAKVTESIRQLAQTAERGAQTARETLSASSEGQRAVTNTQAQLLSLRNEMNNIAAGTQSLLQRSGEISEVVRTISRFASQTNLLALGASLEAAGAGEAGLRFASVANAVRSLADESAKAATRVSQLVREVQTEIGQVAQLADSGASQADAGTKVATEAGERLRRIAELADESASAANSISSLAVEQVQNIESVRTDVQRMAQSAQQTESGSRDGQEASAQLRALSESLTRSLERFRLPA